MSRRMERIGSLIRSVLARAIQERLSDPRIEPLTSITRVDVAADLSIARVHVSVMAKPAQQELTLKALESAVGRLRAEIADQVVLRHVPMLQFKLDHALQQSFETLRQIDAAMAELNDAGADRVPEDEDEDSETGRAGGRPGQEADEPIDGQEVT